MSAKTIWGAIGAMKVLAQGEEIANATSVTIPDVERPTTEIKGAGVMGSWNMPTSGQVSPMSATLTVRAAGAAKKTLGAAVVELELRFVTDCRASDGSLFTAGTKIFFKGYLTKIGGGKGEVGSSRDETFDYSVVRYREIVDGEETLLVDQIANVFRVGGRDLMAGVRSILG